MTLSSRTPPASRPRLTAPPSSRPKAALAAAGLALASGACVAAPAAIGVECRAGPGVDTLRAAEICAGFGQALRASYPDRVFVAGTTPPALRVTVTAAGETENGLALSWILPDGTTREGRPYQISVSDKKPSPGKPALPAAQLSYGLLGLNPLPF